MQKISYHGGHSGELCAHAKDNKQLIIQSYIDRGFTHAGISEHLAPTDDAFLYSDEIALGHSAAFLTERLDSYFQKTVPCLKEKFSSKIELLIGFETEFYGDNPLGRIEEAIAKYQPEIIVASVHHVRNIPIDFDKTFYQQAVESCGGLDDLYLYYYKQQLELIKFLAAYSSSIPIVLGHMDLIKIFSPDFQPSTEVVAQIEKNIGTAVASGLAFEINARALKKSLKEPYPGLSLIKQIKNQGGKFTLGDDSHAASEVGLYYKELEQLIKNEVETLVVVEKSENNSYQWVHLPFEEQE